MSEYIVGEGSLVGGTVVDDLAEGDIVETVDVHNPPLEEVGVDFVAKDSGNFVKVTLKNSVEIVCDLRHKLQTSAGFVEIKELLEPREHSEEYQLPFVAFLNEDRQVRWSRISAIEVCLSTGYRVKCDSNSLVVDNVVIG